MGVYCPKEGEMERRKLSVSGMSCGHCVSRVKKTLSDVPGVQVTDVAVGEATVEFDPTVQSLAAVLAALDSAGYPAAVK
jgi:copper chaperone